MIPMIMTNIFPHPFSVILGEKSSLIETGIFVPDWLLPVINVPTLRPNTDNLVLKKQAVSLSLHGFIYVRVAHSQILLVDEYPYFSDSRIPTYTDYLYY